MQYAYNVQPLTTAAIQFYFDNAGFAYTPAKESEFVGRWLGAARLARAFVWVATRPQLSFMWDTDLEVTAEDNAPRFACMLWDSETNSVRGALGGIDIEDIDASTATDRRVIEAQIALEYMQEALSPPLFNTDLRLWETLKGSRAHSKATPLRINEGTVITGRTVMGQFRTTADAEATLRKAGFTTDGRGNWC